MNNWHMGRRWSGPDALSFDCNCPKTGCGLTTFGSWDPACGFHGPTKTYRQSHPPEECHLLCVDCGHQTAPGTDHSDDDRSCFACGPGPQTPCPSMESDES